MTKFLNHKKLNTVLKWKYQGKIPISSFVQNLKVTLIMLFIAFLSHILYPVIMTEAHIKYG